MFLCLYAAQFRDWVKNVSNLLVSRSLAPVWSSKRGITQMLTQVCFHLVGEWLISDDPDHFRNTREDLRTSRYFHGRIICLFHRLLCPS